MPHDLYPIQMCKKLKPVELVNRGYCIENNVHNTQCNRAQSANAFVKNMVEYLGHDADFFEQTVF